MYRLILAYPGGEVTLVTYKSAVPIQQAQRKAASMASDLFVSWDWSLDGEISAIEPHDNPCMLLIVDGPSGKEVYL